MTASLPNRLKPHWPLLLALAWVFATVGLRPLALPDEGRYVGVAWEMLRSHDWLVPRLDALPYFHKPPLFYWLTAAALQVFGNVEWAARIAPMIGATLAMASTWWFARRRFDDRTAALAMLVLATQPLFFFGAQYANLDMLVAGCITACLFAFADAALADSRDKRSLAAGYAFAALGVLAKGLIGVVLPGFVLTVWLLAAGRWRKLLSLLWWPGLVLFLAIAAPWFVAMQREFPDFLHYFFVVQHFTRFAGGGFNGEKPWWFYLALLALTTLPWWPAAAWAAARRPATDRASIGLALAWIACITLFFSLPRSKLIGYILPVGAPIALLAAVALRAASARWLQAMRIAAPVVATACVAAVVAVAAAAPEQSTRGIARELAARMGPQDEVVFMYGYAFDVPFYAKLQRPVFVVENWDPAEVQSTDNWRREVGDAGAFAPELAKHLLVGRVPPAPCGEGVTWVIGPIEHAWRLPELHGASLVLQQAEKALWRLPPARARRGCAAG